MHNREEHFIEQKRTTCLMIFSHIEVVMLQIAALVLSLIVLCSVKCFPTVNECEKTISVWNTSGWILIEKWSLSNLGESSSQVKLRFTVIRNYSCDHCHKTAILTKERNIRTSGWHYFINRLEMRWWWNDWWAAYYHKSSVCFILSLVSLQWPVRFRLAADI